MRASPFVTRLAAAALVVFGAVACETEEPPPTGTDNDGDGITFEDGDCNDNDPSVGPGLPEVCDGLDQDCDGVDDNGFPDNDGDLAADCGGGVGDCDDNDPDVLPGVLEQCDGKDNNCNGIVDEVADIDGDGFTNCGADPDCDDGDASVNPGAAEACDGRDNDCDANIDEDFDVDLDGLTSCRGDCNDNDASIRPGLAEVCDGRDNNCNNVIDDGFDFDEDGFSICGANPDCDDFVASVNPGATELCDLRDNNCNGVADEGFDQDNDLFSECNGDCDDTDPTIFLNAQELQDGQDNDCNGLIDEPFIDNDADGFSEFQGDCNDADPNVNPGAIEFQGDNADNDCDGATDEALVPCDTGNLSSANPLDFAKAIGICNGELVNARFVGPNGVNSPAGRAVVTSFGTSTAALNRPIEGNKMVLLSSGRSDGSVHDPGTAHDGTINFNQTICSLQAHPEPSGDPGACGAADPANVCDYVEVELTLRVPTNAQSFAYDFQFFSSEYPTFRCTQFDDTFLAILSSQQFDGNISFDNNGNNVSINNGFFDICFDDNTAGRPPNDCSTDPAVTLAGTGFFSPNSGAGVSSAGAGATTKLTTFSPAAPGEVITLRYIIFDEGDDALDSTVAIDNFRWNLNPVAGPVTQQ